MQLKLRLPLKRNNSALRDSTQQPDIYIMWLHADHKILYNYINPINWVKNEQVTLTHTVSFPLPRLQQRIYPYLPSQTPESLICFRVIWSSFCLSLNPCDWFNVFCLHLGAYQWAEFWSICKYTHRHVQQSGTGLFPGMQSSTRKYQTGSERHPRVGPQHCQATEITNSSKTDGSARGSRATKACRLPYRIYTCNIALIFPPSWHKKENLW